MQPVMNVVLLIVVAASASDVSTDLEASYAAAYAVDYSSDVSPVQKVVQLLQTMITKGSEEMQAERVQFAAYSQWCSMTQDKKKADISTNAGRIDSLKADIQKGTADASSLASEISGHQKNIDSFAAQRTNATQVRTAQKTDFQATLKDYVESIDALGRAITTLNKQAYDRKQNNTPALLELSSGAHMAEVKDIVSAFLQASSTGTPEVAGYEFQSKGVIKLLEDLEQKFNVEKVTLEQEEFQKQSAYDKLAASLKLQEEDESKDRDKKTEFRQKKLADVAKNQDDLNVATKTKADDEKYLSDVTATCQQKSTDFDSRQKLRTEEIDAIKKAIEILQSDAVAGKESKILVRGFLQVQSETKLALAVLRSSKFNADVKERLIQFLQDKAESLHSRALSKVVQPVANTKAVVMIKEMLQKLVTKLQGEALADETKKKYCDTEIAASTQTRSALTATVDELNADISKLKASVQQITEDIATTNKQLDDLAAAVKKATEIRQKEKAENEQTIADAKAAQDAIAKATSVLQAFYDKAGQATALIQSDSSDEQPAIFDAPYKGLGESGGILGMIETIAADFARLESDTKSQEETSAADFKKFTSDSEVDKVTKQKDIEGWTTKKEEQSNNVAKFESDLAGSSKELKAAETYFQKLKDDCLNPELSYEEEVKRRNEEIQALKEALEMLSSM